MAFEVPPLPYDYGALEPTIDEQTMRLHHDKHHQAYVDNANAALEGTAVGGQAGRAGPRRARPASPRRSAPPSATTPAGTRTTPSSGRSCRPTAAASRRGSLADAIDDTFGGLRRAEGSA